MPSLEDLIKSGDIEFYSYGRKLDTEFEDWGEYNWDLIHHITEKAGNRIVITGPGVYKHLSDPDNLYGFADFINQVWYSGTTKRYKEGINIHVEVDIEALAYHYKQPTSEPMVNGLGQQVCDSKDWVPEMPYFEKMWNFALDQAIGGMVGYPGHEHPRTDRHFRHVIAQHAQNYMIGTKKQLHRYRKYARQYLNRAQKVSKRLRKNPDYMFENPWCLMEMEQSLRSAREVAENVQNFSYAPPEKKEEEAEDSGKASQP
ncbi:hypothetical protein KY363_06120 [Candidatus Woesearchaeota archaeon]|nr:hypothetical protein [Candidatus Woesearchaeota archaeon]